MGCLPENPKVNHEDDDFKNYKYECLLFEYNKINYQLKWKIIFQQVETTNNNKLVIQGP